jgi:hypothetical protein
MSCDSTYGVPIGVSHGSEIWQVALP